MNTKIAIFGFPRSGTKLLADAFVQNNYHNFGEFLNIYSSYITNDNNTYPSAKRMPIENQRMLKDQREQSAGFDAVNQSKRMHDRLSELKPYLTVEPSILTLWPEQYLLMPHLFSNFKEHHFLCTRRKDELSQFLSRLVTYYNLNYNDEIASVPVTVDLKIVDSMYLMMLRTKHIQNKLVAGGRGRFVDFDELISGTADIGVNYTVTTTDQHVDVSQYIQNLNEVTNRIQGLKNLIGV